MVPHVHPETYESTDSLARRASTIHTEPDDCSLTDCTFKDCTIQGQDRYQELATNVLRDMFVGGDAKLAANAICLMNQAAIDNDR